MNVNAENFYSALCTLDSECRSENKLSFQAMREFTRKIRSVNNKEPGFYCAKNVAIRKGFYSNIKQTYIKQNSLAIYEKTDFLHWLYEFSTNEKLPLQARLHWITKVAGDK